MLIMDYTHVVFLNTEMNREQETCPYHFTSPIQQVWTKPFCKAQ